MSSRVTGGAKSVLAAMLVPHGQANAVEDETPYNASIFDLLCVMMLNGG